MSKRSSDRRRNMNERWLSSIKGSGQRAEYTDTVQTGLKLRVSASGKKVFAVKTRGRDGKMATVTLGAHPMLSLKNARQKAMACHLALKSGESPNIEKHALRQRAEAATVTLASLLDEFEAMRAPKRKIWQPSPKGRSEARRRIDTVFAVLLDRPIEDINLADVSHCISSYQRRCPDKQATANGQVSRARAYLAPVFAWATHRKPFDKLGAGRPGRLEAVNVALTYDPASDDPTICGVRKRVLSQFELQRLLPLLTYPAPSELQMRLAPERDYRPIALRFQLLTAARIDEIASMRWRDFTHNSGIWHKPAIKTIGGKKTREQFLDLSSEAVRLLRSLPRFGVAGPDELVFTNGAGGKLGNWTRITAALQRESQTSDWHRHDLRRTASSIMLAVGVAAPIVDEILGHKASDLGGKVSAAFANYDFPVDMVIERPHPQRDALKLLSRTLELFEAAGAAKGCPLGV